MLLGAGDLITSVSGNSFENDEELFTHIRENIPPPFSDIAVTFCKSLGDEVNFTVLDEFVGLKGRISGEGLNLALQNGLKFLKD